MHLSMSRVPANSVPAAAVRQEGRALSVCTGPKARVGGHENQLSSTNTIDRLCRLLTKSKDFVGYNFQL